MRLLLVEDNDDLVEVLKTGLEESGYTIDVAQDGSEGEFKALADSYDLLVVDWMLPRQNGPTLIKNLRAAGVQTPVLMLTARSNVDDRVDGLDAGADDYLTKPFSFAELFARLRALSRRATASPDDSVLTAGPLSIDSKRRRATLSGETLNLRFKEYALLELLARQPDAVITRTIIAERVWGTAFVSDDVINMTISSLRRRLREVHDVENAPRIRTVRGVGYSLAAA